MPTAVALPARPWLAPVASLAAAATAVAVAGRAGPAGRVALPSCPIHALTGLYCPGCGSTRALHALTHLHAGQAAGHNVLAVAMVPVIIALWAAWAARRIGWWRAPAVPHHRLAVGLLVVIVAFTVARNLPVGAALAP